MVVSQHFWTGYKVVYKLIPIIEFHFDMELFTHKHKRINHAYQLEGEVNGFDHSNSMTHRIF